jgi:hypothetical protein
MRLYLTGLVLVGLLVGCGQASHAPSNAPAAPQAERALSGEADVAGAPAPPPAPDQSVAQDQARATNANPQQPGGAPVMYLAYSYQMGLEIPAQHLANVMDAHVRACTDAGPRLCQLISSSRAGDPGSSMSGSVDLRGEPAWLRTFMGGLDAQASAAGGRVTNQATSTEDLTRNIVDTEAHIRAQTALRDRLQRMLQSHPGRLSDLLDVERELARVQGEIDSTQSELAVMRTRVAMSELTISYASAPQSVGSDTFEPLRHALTGFLGVVVIGFAAIITAIAGLLPFAIVVVPIVWAALRWRTRRGGRSIGQTETAETSHKNDDPA